MHDASLDKFNRYGPIVREEYEWRRPVVHLFDPVDFEKIFRSKERCPKRPESEFVKHYRLQNPDRYPTIGMAHSQGEEWYAERQRIAPILLTRTSRPGVPENHIPSQNEICNDFIRYLSARQDIDHVIPDVREATNRLALESICSLCLGMRMGTLTSHHQTSSPSPSSSSESAMSGTHVISLTGKLFNSYNKLYYGLPTWKLFRSASYKEFCEVEDDIYNMTMRFIDQYVEASGVKVGASDRPASILEALINLPDFDPRHIPITVSDFIAGGTFTVANSLTYLIQNLACNPQTQDIIYQELRSAGLSGEGVKQITCDSMSSQIPYLRAAVKESFRLTSTIPAIVRILENDAVLSGYHVPRGVSTALIAWDSEYTCSHTHVLCDCLF
jgi:cytochrome P450